MVERSAKLLTIVTEAVLENLLIEEITVLGAKGYTVTDARGRGAHGLRSGNWPKEGNIRIEVIGDAKLCAAIVDRLRDNYEQDYGLLMFTTPVEVMDQER
ncbi:MAG TPA: transcriptional regulator [Gammaproteobacteria bacterium]|nr:transcriptional regulator [Gammaproteobacteria bacterium]